MPYRREEFFNNEIYHIVLRGIDDRLIFKNIDNYYRGIFSIYEFNNSKPVSIKERRRMRLQFKKLSRGKTSGKLEPDNRDKLVEVLAFCFMPNHFHLLLKQIKNAGITNFMRKVGTGYAGYFNRKYNRRGHLFQNKFLSIHVKNEEQLKTLFVYIHTNPISLLEPKWKEIGIRDSEKVIEFLENYKWSSYQDYIGKKNFPSITDRELLLNIMGGSQGCKKFVDDWVRYKSEISGSSSLFLE